ncbi:TPA: hypothetical protein L6B59_01425 [Pseudomonas aeruginosa]|nr:hypothetical protein [Pseudomonas aeruginosa]RWY29460.1 hypothetical protein EQH76_06160 [Pseudomonas aeruginosa]RWY37849.1 hypothetical protein EQH74_00890 [Pseudomonas aeruginosa]HBP5381929.1 hypothetical protein [Pseudomonas aeruginosa]HBP6610570.1 hypothetical protein [Pseudomonas aeruginosa]
MHRYDFPPKHGPTKPGSCFHVQAQMRIPLNSYTRGNVKAELCRSGKTRMRLSGSVQIRRCGFPQRHEHGHSCHRMNTIDCSPIGCNRLSSWFSRGNHRWLRNTHWQQRYGRLGKRAA